MTKVNFKKADKSTMRRMINHGGKLLKDKIVKHKKLIETTFNTEVEFIDHRKRETEWIVFNNETHVYKSWTKDSVMGELETKELNYFFEHHNSKLLEDWKLIPPFGCIQKQRKVPGQPLRYLTEQERKQIDLQKFSNWWVEEQLHINEVGIQLSKVYPKFKIPSSKNSIKKENYVFCFGDPNQENLMIDSKTNTYNFVDFQPIGWIPFGHFKCLSDAYLFLAFENITEQPVQKYLDYVSKQLLNRLTNVIKNI